MKVSGARKLIDTTKKIKGKKESFFGEGKFGIHLNAATRPQRKADSPLRNFAVEQKFVLVQDLNPGPPLNRSSRSAN